MTLPYARAVAVVVGLTALGLSACQTTPAPTPAPPAAALIKPTEEPPKPITAEGARNLANNCFTCHGPGGRSPGAIPSLWTLTADEIAGRLKNFKSGAAPSTVMGRHAKGYSDAELEAVAKYIAGQKK